MLGINGGELIIIAIVAVLVIGPTRLPEYAEKLRNLIREVRRMATGAKETIKEESGVDLDSVDWKKLDPRQYDPRRIIREALLDDDVPAPQTPVDPAAAAMAAVAPLAVTPRLEPGQSAPWDSDAT
ncbi:MAG: twin-arginine translocase TatA/TatE family subunit [Actinomycetales bacterium]